MSEAKAYDLRRKLRHAFPQQRFGVFPGFEDDPWFIEFQTQIWFYHIVFETPYIRLHATEIDGKNSFQYTTQDDKTDDLIRLLHAHLDRKD